MKNSNNYLLTQNYLQDYSCQLSLICQKNKRIIQSYTKYQCHKDKNEKQQNNNVNLF